MHLFLKLEHCSKWLDDPHLSYLIEDTLVNAVGDPDVQKIRRHVMDVMDLVDYCNAQTEVIRSGGCAEGFRIRGTDVDIMYVDKLIKVVAETPKNVEMYVAVVRLVLSSDIPPGYVKLAVLTPSAPLQQIRESTKWVSGDYFLSSELFVRWHQRLNPNSVLHGPCVMDRTMHGDHDRAFCLEYKDWPAHANEWIERKRQHGWPSQKLIRKIKNIGCHLMAIGSKTLHSEFSSDDLGNSTWIGDPLQWRMSFSLAEKHLVYSFNNTQFLTYGIFKLLNQEVFSQDQRVNDCICSYFLKTAIFWTIEETPSEYWKPERLIFCVDICFKRLIEWTRSGFCPNYFIRQNNMFMGKVQEWQLDYISSKLYKLHNEGWRCLLHCHSLFDLRINLQNARRLITPNSFPISNPEEDFRMLKSLRRDADTRDGEANIDAALFSEIIAKTPELLSVDVLELELKNSLTRETQRKLDALDLDILRLRRFHNLYQLALIYLNISLTKNTTRSRYAYIRKAFCYLHLVRFSDISKGNLTLATAYYCIGRFDSALDYIKEYDETLAEGLGCIHIPICEGVVRFDQQYPQSFCGRGWSTMDKMSLAASYDFAVYQSMPLIPIEIALEVVMMKNKGSILTIPPELYSGFLKILCYTNMGNLEMAGIVSVLLKDNLQKTTKRKQYLAYIMLGVTFVKLGNYEEALRCYCLAHIRKRRLAVSVQNADRPEWHTRTSVLFYIAQMLRCLIPV